MAFASPNTLQFIPFNKAVPIATGNYTISTGYTGYTQYIFTGPGTFSLNNTPSSKVYALLVGGGGAGGNNGGGGGGGGAVNAVVATIVGGITYRVYVGGGGIGCSSFPSQTYQIYNSSGQASLVIPQSSSTYGPYGNYYLWSPYTPYTLNFYTTYASTYVTMTSAYFNAVQSNNTYAYNNYIDGGLVIAAASTGSTGGMYYSTTSFSDSTTQYSTGVRWLSPTGPTSSGFPLANYPIVIMAMNRDSGKYSIVVTNGYPTAPVAYSVNYAFVYTSLTSTLFTGVSSWVAAASTLGPYPVMYLCNTTTIYSITFSATTTSTSAPTVAAFLTTSAVPVALACNGSGTIVVYGSTSTVYIYNSITKTQATQTSFIGAITGCTLSSDGTRLTVSTSSGYAYTASSYNSGYSWTWATLPVLIWNGSITSLSSSLDGSILAAASLTGSTPYVSTDYGTTWRQQTSFSNNLAAYTSGITVSPYGSQIFAAGYTGPSSSTSTGYIYQATVYPTTYTGYTGYTLSAGTFLGNTGTNITSAVYYNTSYTGTTDGNFVLYSNNSTGVYLSTSSVNSISQPTGLTGSTYTRIASSPNGQSLLATFGLTGSSSTSYLKAGLPFYSTNYGTSWSTLSFTGSTSGYCHTACTVSAYGNMFYSLAYPAQSSTTSQCYLLWYPVFYPTGYGGLSVPLTTSATVSPMNFLVCNKNGTVIAFTSSGLGTTSYSVYTMYMASVSGAVPTFSTPVAGPYTSNNWAGLVMSADGSSVFALSIPNSSSASGTPVLWKGYCSDQNGYSWRWSSPVSLAAYTGTYVSAYTNPSALAASGDCRVMSYVVYNIAAYWTTDFGNTWSQVPTVTNPIGVSVSPNGYTITLVCYPSSTFTFFKFVSYSPVSNTSTASDQYSLLAYGGGKGGNRDNGVNEGGFGFGSGGGAGSTYVGSSSIATFFLSGATPGYTIGNYGGNAYYTYYAGGGGGGAGNTGGVPTYTIASAGYQGTFNSKGGPGGTGASWWLNSTFYGGGGGGGAVVSNGQFVGYSGGTGGAGTYLWGGGGTGGQISSSTITYGGPGLPNTGGGGGGGSGSLNLNASGNGGSGVVILALRNT